MKKSKVHWFFNDTYFANVYFLPGFSDDEVTGFIGKQFGFSYTRRLLGDARCIEVQDDDGRWGLITHTREKNLYPRTVAAVAHECVHAANNVLRRVGVRIKIGKNDEAQAYLVQWFFRHCYDHLKGGK